MHNITIFSPLTIFIFGAITLAFIYHLVLFIFNKDRLLIHYNLYLLFATLFSFFLTRFIAFIFGNDVQRYFSNYLAEPLQILYLAMYFNFILQSIEVVKKGNQFLYRSWVFIMSILFGYVLLYFFGKTIFHFENDLWSFIGIRIFIFLMTTLMLWQCFKLRHITFQLYILIGSSVYLIFGLISFISNLYYDNLSEFSIFPTEWLLIGTFSDIVFFSIAMSYRNNMQWKKMNLTLLNDAKEMIKMQRIVLEKHTALENERSRIAAELHDDLGSGLTRITYLSQVALNNNVSQSELLKINKTSSELIENMSEIIWAMKEENNSIEDLITYIKMYVVEYLDLNHLDFEIDIPETYDSITVNGEIRRNIFLTIKEALHNIAKHANATKVTVNIDISDYFKIIIHDNGIGFDSNFKSSKPKNGILNMKKRIATINGTLIINSKEGTTIEIEIPIKQLG